MSETNTVAAPGGVKAVQAELRSANNEVDSARKWALIGGISVAVATGWTAHDIAAHNSARELGWQFTVEALVVATEGGLLLELAAERRQETALVTVLAQHELANPASYALSGTYRTVETQD